MLRHYVLQNIDYSNFVEPIKYYLSYLFDAYKSNNMKKFSRGSENVSPDFLKPDLFIQTVTKFLVESTDSIRKSFREIKSGHIMSDIAFMSSVAKTAKGMYGTLELMLKYLQESPCNPIELILFINTLSKYLQELDFFVRAKGTNEEIKNVFNIAERLRDKLAELECPYVAVLPFRNFTYSMHAGSLLFLFCVNQVVFLSKNKVFSILSLPMQIHRKCNKLNRVMASCEVSSLVFDNFDEARASGNSTPRD